MTRWLAGGGLVGLKLVWLAVGLVSLAGAVLFAQSPAGNVSDGARKGGSRLVQDAVPKSPDARSDPAPPAPVSVSPLSNGTPLPRKGTRAAGAALVKHDGEPPVPARLLATWQDDAELRDVLFLGDHDGWAVGDHGTVWHTSDRGQTWNRQPVPTTAHLRSVSFLTNKVGWVAGYRYSPYTSVGEGVLLITQNGGESWEHVETTVSLPPLMRVRFFSPERGLVVGASRGQSCSGVFATEDGGATWQERPVTGTLTAEWRAAAFVNPELAVVAGRRGSAAFVVDGKVVSARETGIDFRDFLDVTVSRDLKGVLVGEGGLVLRTDNAGLVWQPLEPEFPRHLAELFDFHTVAAQGDKIWLAGVPGSVVLHSPDGGRSWKKQITGETVPLRRLHFSTPERGYAVGALGVILRTTDGGRHWETVRGADRRAAVLAWHARPEDVPWTAIANTAGEQGYRVQAQFVARVDGTPRGLQRGDDDLRGHDAVVSAGGHGAGSAWGFPLAIPGLERDKAHLLAEWNRRSEGRWQELLLRQVVTHIRTWRPSVIWYDAPHGPDAPLHELMKSTLHRAVEQAADATQFIDQQTMAGLGPWRTARVFERLRFGDRASVWIDADAYLPRAQTSARLLAGEAVGRLPPQPFDSVLAAGRSQSFRLIPVQTDVEANPTGVSATGVSGKANPSPTVASASAPSGLLAGLDIPAPSEARRALAQIDDERLEARIKQMQAQRNTQALIERHMSEPQLAAQWIAQTPRLVKDLPRREAAAQLSRLATSYAQHGLWKYAEEVWLTLSQDYLDLPAGHEAARRLIQLWGSEEMMWRQLRSESRELIQASGTVDAAVRAFEAAQDKLRQQAEGRKPGRIPVGQTPLRERPPGLADGTPGEAEPGASRSATNSGREDPSVKPLDFRQTRRGTHGDVAEVLRARYRGAAELAERLRKANPAAWGEPGLQFSLASSFRRAGNPRATDEVLRRFSQNPDDSSVWSRAVVVELWQSQAAREPSQSVIPCRFAPAKPRLDGVLSDVCWQAANELVLRARSDDSVVAEKHPFVLLACDAEYLYIAGSFPRSPLVPATPVTTADRSYDEASDELDRFTISLDVDRDYAVWYSFTVDQTGRTSDRCWDDASWNPEWFVACAGDAESWRVELAIPVKELTPHGLSRDSVWNVHLQRTIPGKGVESWTHPASVSPASGAVSPLRFTTR